MLYTKACPRCSGDIKLDRDNYGVYAKCLQCGFNRDFKTRREAGSPIGVEAPMSDFEAGLPGIMSDDQQRDAA